MKTLMSLPPKQAPMVERKKKKMLIPLLILLYFTRVQLGNPPKEFYVQIDTGSNILWVACNPCAELRLLYSKLWANLALALYKLWRQLRLARLALDTQPRDLYDVPTIERSANDQDESTSTPIQENENIGEIYRIDGDKDHGDLCNVELARANVEEIVFDAMVGESKKSIVQVNKSNRASTSSRRTVECRSEKPWLRSQSQKPEPTPPISEDPHASTHLPSTITDPPSSPTIANPDTNTTAAAASHQMQRAAAASAVAETSSNCSCDCCRPRCLLPGKLIVYILVVAANYLTFSGDILSPPNSFTDGVISGGMRRRIAAAKIFFVATILALVATFVATKSCICSSDSYECLTLCMHEMKCEHQSEAKEQSDTMRHRSSSIR
uniref:Peptidase A1 domain-containing protein n=1 Tax=Ananas comosus var. bracteatus TaxID=296719 RepID=A0A6V7NFM9_ANACO|nr:unnamed protein product [Ananas comosus var. bracteatus]